MSNEEIIEGNKLIADFMEVDYEDVYTTDADNCTIPLLHSLRYDLDWSLLMSACRKFDTLTDDFNFDDRMMYEMLCDDTDESLCCYDIEPVFQNLVKAINWYNTRPHQ